MTVTVNSDIAGGSAGGSVTSVDVSGGTTGLTTSGGPVTDSGTITIAGALDEVNGGTGQTTYAAGDILYASASNTLSKLAKGTDTEVLTLASGVPTWAAASGGVTQTIGTYLPTFTFATAGDLSVVYTSQNGHYVRTGDLVFISIYLSCTPTFSTASGSVQISLPFTQRNLTNVRSHFNFKPNSSNITPPGGTDSMMGVCEGNVNYMTIGTFTAGESVGNLAPANFSSGGDIFLRFTGTFIAAA